MMRYRYVFESMDPESTSTDNLKKIERYLAAADDHVKSRMIQVINVPEYLLSESAKMEMLYYLDDEDFENERFAIISLVDEFLRMANTADAYGD